MKKKEHKIDSVEPGSIADEMGIEAAVSQSARHRDRKVKYPVLRIWGLSMKYLMQRNWSV